MRTSGLIHAELISALVGLRHTDTFAVSDSGLPVPAGVPVIDLGISYGFPGFVPVVELVLAEVTVEAAWGSADVAAANPQAADLLTNRLAAELIDHEEFKRRIGRCRFVVRTGEATPYANVLFRAGVPWLP
ncbi:D-ribose pyranase [Nocardia uniformis]|uniref:D-ribose pyranase n=1 Tax=Nocardia uniformis TaxID=53432 RepID=A0A849C1C5_9NOCA|nr:D-ribose pyranase [Nocardia uniformis]NNH71286.1 D-ribose pyranase [Nocardia uniformis]